ncbi:MAG: hypothetical protein K2X93_19035, partial [Candidatus Obscuribacterales bacterium]|nr:hypothetical protein [Candidatus Obscuribacterales bacterium]
MSKKVVRSRDSYVKNWTAAIMGSLFFVSMQSAQAAGDDRPKFRDFKENNPGIDRQTLRHMFRDQVRGGGGNGGPSIGVIPVNTNNTGAINAPTVQNQHQNRLD